MVKFFHRATDIALPEQLDLEYFLYYSVYGDYTEYFTILP